MLKQHLKFKDLYLLEIMAPNSGNNIKGYENITVQQVCH